LGGSHQLDGIKAAARTMSIELMVVEFRDAAGIDASLNAGLTERPQALIQLGSPLINQLAKRIADILASHRIPGISPFRLFSESGGLMSYGPNLPHMFSRVAPYVSRIVKGSKPSDLPIERPTKFEFVINLKTAKALGLEFHPQLLATADEVIEQRCCLLRCMSLLMALSGHAGMSVQRSLLGAKRTWRGSAEIDANDPNRTS
jgi:putative ABC transport system substrate-binding protein